MCSLSRIHLSLTLQHGWCSVVGWNAWDSSSHCRVVAGVQGGLGQVEVGPTYRHVKSLQGCSVKRMSIMFIKHHQTMVFMVDVVDCYSNDCELHNCSSLSLPDVVSCWKASEYSTFISSLCSFSLSFSHHVSILGLSYIKWWCFHNLKQIMLSQDSLLFQYQPIDVCQRDDSPWATQNTHVRTKVEGWLKELSTFRVHQAAKPVEGDDEENGMSKCRSVWVKVFWSGVVKDEKTTTVRVLEF